MRINTNDIFYDPEGYRLYCKVRREYAKQGLSDFEISEVIDPDLKLRHEAHSRYLTFQAKGSLEGARERQLKKIERQKTDLARLRAKDPAKLTPGQKARLKLLEHRATHAPEVTSGDIYERYIEKSVKLPIERLIAIDFQKDHVETLAGQRFEIRYWLALGEVAPFKVKRVRVAPKRKPTR